MNYTPTFDRFEHSTVVAALIHYALHIAEPSECIRCLEALVPEPLAPWDETIPQSRADYRAILNKAEANQPRFADEVAAMRER